MKTLDELLYLAAKHGSREIADELLRLGAIRQPRYLNERSSDWNLLQKLFNFGWDPTGIMSNGQTLLHTLIKTPCLGRSNDRARILEGLKSDIRCLKAKDSRGESMLSYFMKYDDHQRSVELCLDKRCYARNEVKRILVDVKGHVASREDSEKKLTDADFVTLVMKMNPNTVGQVKANISSVEAWLRKTKRS